MIASRQAGVSRPYPGPICDWSVSKSPAASRTGLPASAAGEIPAPVVVNATGAAADDEGGVAAGVARVDDHR